VRLLTLVLAAALTGLAGTTALSADATAAAAPPLPARMRDTGGGSQLVTAVVTGSSNAGRTGTLTWWQRTGSTWRAVGSAPARFGYNGLSANRREGDGTTPVGLFGLPFAFGIRPNPGTRMPWKPVDAHSWWDENSLDARYNTWYENCPATSCWTSARRKDHVSEHLADYPTQYAYAAVIGFNTGQVKVRPPARPSGSGIFLHVNGSGYTGGCVSIPQPQLAALLRWLDPAARPHIAIGSSVAILNL